MFCCRPTHRLPSVCDTMSTGLSGSRKYPPSPTRLHQSAGCMSARLMHLVTSRRPNSSASSASVRRICPSSRSPTVRGISMFTIGRNQSRRRCITARRDRRSALWRDSRSCRWNRPTKFLVLVQMTHISLFCVVEFSMLSVSPRKYCSTGCSRNNWGSTVVQGVSETTVGLFYLRTWRNMFPIKMHLWYQMGQG